MARFALPLLLAAGCSRWTKGGAEGSFPCGVELLDAWRVEGGKGGSLRIVVDTIDAATTFDPYFLVYEAAAWTPDARTVGWGEEIDGADDEFACTFPPPEYECPQLVLPVTDDVGVLVGASGACAGPDASYRIEVELDGKPGRLSHLGQITEDELDGTGRDSGRGPTTDG